MGRGPAAVLALVGGPGGGLTGWAIAVAVALTEVLVIRTIFATAPGLIGAAPVVIALLLVATLGSALILWRVPKGRWGI